MSDVLDGVEVEASAPAPTPRARVRQILERPADGVTVRPLSALDVAAWFLDRLGSMDSYRLQKLVYYAQAEHLAYYNSRLYADRIEAWPYGPVVPALWQKHKGRRMVDKIAGGDPAAAERRAEVLDTLEFIVDRYEHLTGKQLSARTHDELPWRKARQGMRERQISHVEITVESLRDYFRQEAEAEQLSADQDPASEIFGRPTQYAGATSSLGPAIATLSETALEAPYVSSSPDLVENASAVDRAGSDTAS